MFQNTNSTMEVENEKFGNVRIIVFWFVCSSAG